MRLVFILHRHCGNEFVSWIDWHEVGILRLNAVLFLEMLWNGDTVDRFCHLLGAIELFIILFQRCWQY